jgi:catechol 2,3-dioxygenase-like lactoylglutathione lyase family enzyme
MLARMLTHLDHVIVAVKDLGGATKTLSALIGRAPSWRGEHPGQGTANALFRLRNTYVELLAPSSAQGFGATLAARLEAEGEGLLGMAFRTADAAACAAALAARGVAAAPPLAGEGRDLDSLVVRRWRNVLLPAAAARGLLLFAIEHEGPDDGLPPAALRGGAEAAVSGLDHVVVLSGDPEATRKLYGETLGLRLALDRVFEERRLRLLFFRVGGVTVEIAQRLDAAPEARDRFLGLSFEVPDADAARERVAAAGFDVSEVRPGMKPGTRVCSVRGRPLGVDTLLIQPVSRDAGRRPAA